MGERQQHDSLVGAWILDQYQIIEQIAEGGMGRVYLAEQVAMERYAAIKVLPAQVGGLSATRRRRFQQEARAASRLAHANIVTAYNFGELADGTMFFAMEYIEGESLAQMLDRGALAPRDAVDIAYQCASALAHAHDGGVVHRDFKPENVMVAAAREDGSQLVKVVDFGIAHIVEEASLTRTGELVGTPRYISPEQCRGESATPKSDQYAFGLVLYEMIKGQPAFSADSTLGYLHHHQFAEAPPLASSSSELPRELSNLVARTLSKAADDRYGSMREVREVLSRLRAATADRDVPITSEVVQRRHVTTPMPAVIAWLGERAAEPEMASQLGASGLLLAQQHDAPSSALASGGTYDAAALCVGGVSWREEADAWSDVTLDNVLVCVDGHAERADLIEMARRFRHLTVGPQPVDPVVVSAALSWMLRSSKPGVQHLFPNEPIQLVQIRSADQKAAAIDALLDDATAQRLRRQTRLGLAEVAEELIINALYRAPGASTPGAQAPLPAGREVTLSWVIDPRYIAVSVRDRFGTLTRERLFSYVSGSQEGLREVRDTRPSGMGVGLQLVSRVAHHVIAALSPDRWCEILALVDRRAAARSVERTLTAITHAGWTSRDLGGALTMRSFVHGKTRHLQLEGDIGEQCDFAPVFEWDGDTRVDLSQVRRINSMGVRNWVAAARERPVGSRMSFERCAVSWVRQLGMLPELVDVGPILSLQVPYFCEACQRERTVVATARTLSVASPPQQSCSSCGEPMDFDGQWQAYVAFLAAE
ncbi:MAG: serine/threonine protein kinase [Myxococcales bacterium]|nr:serine/threonine protein kinase [Myxococcales bacterium]